MYKRQAIPHRWLDKTCRPLTKEEIHRIVKSFSDGAYNAKRGGFDGVAIHAVHEGYLLDQFAISMFNRRDDEYGGSRENRLRFAREVVEEIKARCGQDFPVILRFSVKSMIKDWREGALPGEEFEEKGRDVEEGLEAAKLLVQYGYDALDLSLIHISPVQRMARSRGSREMRNTSRSAVSPVSRAAGRISITPTKSERTERISRVIKRSRVKADGLMVNTPLSFGLVFKVVR